MSHPSGVNFCCNQSVTLEIFYAILFDGPYYRKVYLMTKAG